MIMGSDEGVDKTVKDRFNGLAADFYDAGIQKQVPESSRGLCRKMV
jgi:hypothetical protein